MNEQQGDSIQNQFTEYLMSAITNSRINYFDKKLKQNKRVLYYGRQRSEIIKIQI